MSLEIKSHIHQTFAQKSVPQIYNYDWQQFGQISVKLVQGQNYNNFFFKFISTAQLLCNKK